MNKKYVLVLVSIIASALNSLNAQLIARRSTHADRRGSVGYGYQDEVLVNYDDAYRHGEPCCPWRYEGVGDYGAAEVHDLREKLRDELDSATYQANWQWDQRRINEIQSRLGRIVE